MTWHADQTEGRLPPGKERDELIAERERLVFRIELLKGEPMGKSQAAIKGRQEDLIALAKKVLAIDKKLGRQV